MLIMLIIHYLLVGIHTYCTLSPLIAGCRSLILVYLCTNVARMLRDTYWLHHRIVLDKLKDLAIYLCVGYYPPVLHYLLTGY